MESVTPQAIAAKPGTVPLALRLIRQSIAILSAISPALAARWVDRIWFSTQHHAVPKREQEWVRDAEQTWVDSEQGPLAVYRWGNGPTVLLVHGWSGRATQLGAFAQPLVNAGFKVLAFDAPAHGKSPGKQTNMFRVVEAMNRVVDNEGPVHAIICHSFGAMVSARALATGFEAGKVVCISPPANADYILDSFFQSLRVPEKTRIAFIKRLNTRFGEDVRNRISTEHNARNLNIPALIIHDRNDREVPWQQGEQLAQSWPGAVLELTEGLGHRRILRHKDIVDRVVKYIRD